MSQVLGTARDISVNIENTLLFALVGGVSRTLQTYVSAQTVSMLCVLLWVADRSVLARTTDTSRSVWRILLQVNVILLSDSVMNTVSGEHGHAQAGSSNVNMLSLLTRNTVLVILLAMFTSQVSEDAYTARVVSLMLFVYTESIQDALRTLSLGIVSVALSTLLYVLIHKHQERIDASASLRYVARAVNMMAINSTLSHVTDLPLTLQTKTVLLVALLVCLDLASAFVPMFVECRGYALWKTARYLRAVFESGLADPVLSVGVTCVVLSVRNTWSSHNHTFVELAVLVAVNVMVAGMTPTTPRVESLENSVVLFVYVLVLDVLTSLGK